MARDGVLMVMRLAPPAYTGAGRQAVRLARRLLAGGRPVVILTSSRTARRPAAAEIGGVPAVRWPTRAWTRRSEKALLSLGLALHLLRSRRRYAVVHLHGAAFLLRTLQLLKPLLGFRVVYKATMAGMDDAPGGRASLRTVDRWVCIAEPLARAAVEHGVPAERVERIPNGVDLAAFRPAEDGERTAARAELGLPEEATVWASVGALVPRKRQHLLVEAWTLLPAPRPLLLLVGPPGEDPDYAEALGNLVARAGLESSVRFLGSRADVARILRAADGFVFASGHEGLPNAVVEALAAGLPVVTTAFEALADVLAAGGDRVRVVAADPTALAEAVAAPLPGPGLVPEGLRELDLDRVAARYDALYRELAGA